MDAGLQQINFCEEDDDGQQEESKLDPSSDTTTTTVRPIMTCGEVCASMRHILTSDEAVEQTKVGPDGVEKKVGLLGRLNARRSLLTLTHPVMVALMFSALGLYDAGTDVLLAATFGETVVAEFAPSNVECVQLFDPTWSGYSLSSQGSSYDRYNYTHETKDSCGRDMYLYDFDQSTTSNGDQCYFPALGNYLREDTCSFPASEGDILADPGKAAAYFFESCANRDRGVPPDGVTVGLAKLTKRECSTINACWSTLKFLQCMPECFDRDVSSFTKGDRFEADFRTYDSLSPYVIYMIIAKEGLRLLAWLYFFTVGGINARKTSLFKYVIYSPGTILFYRLPAVQQMIVETTQSIEGGQEAPWLKVRAMAPGASE